MIRGIDNTSYHTRHPLHTILFTNYTTNSLQKPHSGSYQQRTASTASLVLAIRYAYITLLSSLNLWQTKHITVDSCDDGINVLNHCTSWSKFVTTTTPVLRPFVTRYQKKHSPTHHPDYHPIFISFFHLQRSIASSLFKLRAWQTFCTTSLHVLFGLPLGLVWSPPPHIPYSLHPISVFFSQHMPIPLILQQPVLL